MGISVFEVIGPAMVGPSSSHTAGMARIGLMANRIIAEDASEICLELSPKLRTTYSGHKSDAALFAGTVGIAENDPKVKDAIEIVHKQGIETKVAFLPEGQYPQNTARISVISKKGARYSVTGTSVGGGSIIISEIDKVPLEITPQDYHLVIWSQLPVSAQEFVSGKAEIRVQQGKTAEEMWITVISGKMPFLDIVIEELKKCTKIIKFSYVLPVLTYGSTQKNAKDYQSCEAACIEAKTKKLTLSEVALEYEAKRSGFSTETILAQMEAYWEQMKTSVRMGEQENKLLFGLTGGKDAKKLRDAIAAGKSVSGGIIPEAVAMAIGVMEYNASMGCIVAAPTAGSSGIVPACMVSLQNKYGFSDREIENALFVSALMGVIMERREVSFSGSVGGCQGEIGVSSAIAAAGIASLFTKDAETITHAMALCLKNLLGLVCDPIAGPVEVPCIKRNAVGVANAFISADLALAGIKSFIPPDEVIDALVDVERRMPNELKCATIGGLACTCTAKRTREQLGKTKV